jgi:hypothetical protein
MLHVNSGNAISVQRRCLYFMYANQNTPYTLLHKNKCQYVTYKNRLYAVHINQT